MDNTTPTQRAGSPTPDATKNFRTAMNGLAAATERAAYGEAWDQEQRTARMMARRDKITGTLGYALALSLMFWVIILGWALMVLIIRAVTP